MNINGHSSVTCLLEAIGRSVSEEEVLEIFKESYKMYGRVRGHDDPERAFYRWKESVESKEVQEDVPLWVSLWLDNQRSILSG
ncbi:MAG: hypothetical protein WDZ90_02045 [Candidatus Paceibacterota bacterium]